MTRTRLLTAAALAASLFLSGCSGSASSSTTAKNLDSVTVSSNSPDATPDLTIKQMPLTFSSVETKVLTPGDGAVLTDTSLASFDYALYSAVDGAELGSSYPQSPVGIDLADDTVMPVLRDALTGKAVGTRFVLGVPAADGFGETGSSALGVDPNEDIVFVIDVTGASTPLAEATGTAVAPKEGLPTVTMNGDQPATISIPTGVDAPTQTVVQPLIVGEGAQVETGQTIRVAYTGALWKDGSVFDSSLGSEPGYIDTPIGVSQVVAGWDKGLVGQPVGSRVLLVIPPADGYGSEGQGPISGTDTMVFVVDILAAY